MTKTKRHRSKLIPKATGDGHSSAGGPFFFSLNKCVVLFFLGEEDDILLFFLVCLFCVFGVCLFLVVFF